MALFRVRSRLTISQLVEKKQGSEIQILQQTDCKRKSLNTLLRRKINEFYCSANKNL